MTPSAAHATRVAAGAVGAGAGAGCGAAGWHEAIIVMITRVKAAAINFIISVLPQTVRIKSGVLKYTISRYRSHFQIRRAVGIRPLTPKLV
jgi:hypothetical protein